MVQRETETEDYSNQRLRIPSRSQVGSSEACQIVSTPGFKFESVLWFRASEYLCCVARMVCVHVLVGLGGDHAITLEAQPHWSVADLSLAIEAAVLPSESSTASNC